MLTDKQKYELLKKTVLETTTLLSNYQDKQIQARVKAMREAIIQAEYANKQVTLSRYDE
jgi:negative regulator of replication initiation